MVSELVYITRFSALAGTLFTLPPPTLLAYLWSGSKINVFQLTYDPARSVPALVYSATTPRKFQPWQCSYDSHSRLYLYGIINVMHWIVLVTPKARAGLNNMAYNKLDAIPYLLICYRILINAWSVKWLCNRTAKHLQTVNSNRECRRVITLAIHLFYKKPSMTSDRGVPTDWNKNTDHGGGKLSPRKRRAADINWRRLKVHELPLNISLRI